MDTTGVFASRLVAAVTLLACLCCSPPVAGDPVRFTFELIAPHSGGTPFDGSGFFIVDDPIPTTGTVTLVASDLSGMVGASWNFVSLAQFGYRFGNTVDFFVGNPADNNIETATSPHHDALITFSNGVPVGISYSESHTCDTGHHCEPQLPVVVPQSIDLDGTSYMAIAFALDASSGVITISPVPEPGPRALLLVGMVALGIYLGSRMKGDPARSDTTCNARRGARRAHAPAVAGRRPTLRALPMG